MLDATIRRCVHRYCNHVGRWTNDDGERVWCKDHAPGGSVWSPVPVPDPPPELEGVLIGSASLRMRVKK